MQWKEKKRWASIHVSHNLRHFWTNTLPKYITLKRQKGTVHQTVCSRAGNVLKKSHSLLSPVYLWKATLWTHFLPWCSGLSRGIMATQCVTCTINQTGSRCVYPLEMGWGLQKQYLLRPAVSLVLLLPLITAFKPLSAIVYFRVLPNFTPAVSLLLLGGFPHPRPQRCSLFEDSVSRHSLCCKVANKLHVGEVKYQNVASKKLWNKKTIGSNFHKNSFSRHLGNRSCVL